MSTTFIIATESNCALPTCDNKCLKLKNEYVKSCLDKDLQRASTEPSDTKFPNFQCAACDMTVCAECSLGCITGAWDDGVEVAGTDIKAIEPGACSVSFGMKCPMCNAKHINVSIPSLTEWMVSTKTQRMFTKEPPRGMGGGGSIAIVAEPCGASKCDGGMWYKCKSLKLWVFPTALFFGSPMNDASNLNRTISAAIKKHLIGEADKARPHTNLGIVSEGGTTAILPPFVSSFMLDMAITELDLEPLRIEVLPCGRRRPVWTEADATSLLQYLRDNHVTESAAKALEWFQKVLAEDIPDYDADGAGGTVPDYDTDGSGAGAQEMVSLESNGLSRTQKKNAKRRHKKKGRGRR